MDIHLESCHVLNMKTDDASRLSVSDIADAVGVRLRTVVFWADQGVLQPIEGTASKGKGSFRAFSADEIPIARIAGKLAAITSTVSDIRQVTDQCRQLRLRPNLQAIIQEITAIAKTIDLDQPWPPGAYGPQDLLNVLLRMLTRLAMVGGFRGGADAVVRYTMVDDVAVPEWFVVPDHLMANSVALTRLGSRDFVAAKVLRLDAAEDLQSQWGDRKDGFLELVPGFEEQARELMAVVNKLVRTHLMPAVAPDPMSE